MLVDTFGTGKVSDELLTKAVLATFDARPGMLIQELDLRRPIFRKTAAYGHFGREEAEFTWEMTPRVAELTEKAGAKANGAAKCTAAKPNGNGIGKANGNGKAAPGPPTAKKPAKNAQARA